LAGIMQGFRTRYPCAARRAARHSRWLGGFSFSWSPILSFLNFLAKICLHFSGSLTNMLTASAPSWWHLLHSSRAGHSHRTCSIVSSSAPHSSHLASSSICMKCLYAFSSFACPVLSLP
jgi:hypothetical protein